LDTDADVDSSCPSLSIESLEKKFGVNGVRGKASIASVPPGEGKNVDGGGGESGEDGK
jgi:hypothetical protein